MSYEMPLPRNLRFQMAITNGDFKDFAYNTPLLAGISPELGVGRFAAISRVWAVFGANDTSANDSNNTEVEFRVGTLSSFTQVATVHTGQVNYSAGDVLSKTLNFVVPRGKLLFVYPKANGSGTTNMVNDSFYFGFDLNIEET
jgi:hypothetical protein